MQRPTVVNLKTFRKENNGAKPDVYICRPMKFGNPFHIGKDGTRFEVIQKYADWIKTQPRLMDALPDLAGKTLGCYCYPLPCHGDVLAAMVEALPDPPLDNLPFAVTLEGDK